MDEKKKYPLPKELIDLVVEYVALEELRDTYVKQTFGFKKALKCSIEAESTKQKFWNKVHKLYPETVSKGLSYSLGDDYAIEK